MNNGDPDQAYNSSDLFGDEMSAILRDRELSMGILSSMDSHQRRSASSNASTNPSGSGCSSASVLLERIERSNNEAVIMCNIIELCQLLVMGNEESLVGFPTKQSVPCLVNLLRMETNFEIMLNACRALQYLIEVLPRSTQVVLDAVPALLEKLQVVECVDVAEHSLQVLELLSKKHSKAILKQNGIASCLKFIDFFSTSAQRTSLAIVSNCCLVVAREDFHLVRDSLAVLSARLLIQDKKCVESTCLCFSRLVENFKNDPERLEELAGQDLFKNLQYLLLESPSMASSSTFVIILHMFNILSTCSSNLYLHLLRSNIADTLLRLLIGPPKTDETSQHFELVSRSAQEIFEIISLIGNLLPSPPHGGIFSINSTALCMGGSDDFQECAGTSIVWQWCDSKGTWHSYLASDSRIIEVAHHMGEPEIGMSLMGRMYTIDFQMMEQINEETGTSRPIQRTVTCSRSQNSEASRQQQQQQRLQPRRDVTCREETSLLVASLLPVVYEIFCTTASQAVKHKCLQTLLRMVLHSDSNELRVVLKNVPLSSSIAGMLTSYDSRTTVTAIQLCHVLMERLPEVFSIFFQRQGVLHQMLHLAQSGLHDPSSSSSSRPPTKSVASGHPREHPHPSTFRRMDPPPADRLPHRPRPTAAGSPSPPSLVLPSTRVGYRASEGSSSGSAATAAAINDPSLLTMSTPVVFRPAARGSTSEAGATPSSPTSLSSPSSPSVNLPLDAEPHRSSLVQVRLADLLKIKKSSYRQLKEEPSLFRFGPIQSEGGSHSTVTNQLSSSSSKSTRDYSHAVSSSPPHHHSTPSVYHPSKNLGSLVSQRIASISSAAAAAASSSSSSSSSSHHHTISVSYHHHQHHHQQQQQHHHRNNNNSSGGGSHFCNGEKVGRLSPPVPRRHQCLIPPPPSSSSASASASSSSSYVSATKARLFGNKEQQQQLLQNSSNSGKSSLTFPRSLLASLNPRKWVKSTPSNQKNLGKESIQSKPSEPLEKKVANSKEVINAWIVQHASAFMDKYFNRPVHGHLHPSLNILSQLSVTLLNLGNIATDEEHLRNLAVLVSNNDISPFEFVQSSFIDLVTSYLTTDLTTLKLQRLRIFLHVFLGCPKSEHMSRDDVWSSAFTSSQTPPLHHLVVKLLNCFHHLEKFQLKTSDHSSAFRTSLASDPNTYRFYKADLIKCSLQLHPSCSGTTNRWNVGLVRIDPFAIVQSLEGILTQAIKIFDSDLSDEEDYEESTSMDAEQGEGTNSLSSSSSSSSSLSSPTPLQGKGFEFYIGDDQVPDGMTIYQAIKRFSLRRAQEGEAANPVGSPALNHEHRIWSAEHVIWFKPKGLTPQNPAEVQGTSSKSGSIVIHPRKAKFEPSITIHQNHLQLHRHRHFQHHHQHHPHPNHPLPPQQQQHHHHHHYHHQQHHQRPPWYPRHHHRHQSRSSRRHHNYQHAHLKFDVPVFGGKPASSSSVSRGGSRLRLEPLDQQNTSLTDPSLPVLSLLRIVRTLSSDWHLLYGLLDWSDVNFADKKAINASVFISNKLTYKLMKQLQDPIVILSGSLPLWVSHVPIMCPFLLSFQTRQHLFNLICLDKGRALLKFNERSTDQSSSSSSAGDGHGSGGKINCRVERVKKVIKRRKILEQAEQVMSDMVGSSAILEIKYDQEIGFGLGPTLEFYALVSQKVQRSDLHMWIGLGLDESHSNFYREMDDFKDSLSEVPMEDDLESSKVASIPSPDGLDHVRPQSPFLHPLPLPEEVEGEKLKTLLDRFEFLGRFMAKSLVDSRLVDLPLSPMFYKWLLGGEETADISDLRHVDMGLYSSLMKLQTVVNRRKAIEESVHLTPEDKKEQIDSLTLDGMTLDDLCLTFTLPGYDNFELLPNGQNELVTIDNLELYIELVVHWMLVKGIYRQMAAFKLGFETFLPLSSLQFFYADELDRLFCGAQKKEEWTTKYLSEVCRPDHGYSQDSAAVQFLYAILSSFDNQQQRMFVQFITGSPRLPVGGLKSLNPPLTIVRKTMEHASNPDDFLPSVMTCVNYLKLPDYSSPEAMQRKLEVAMKEGRLSFHLS